METKLEYLLNSSNILNMFEIQKYRRNKKSEKDGYLRSNWTYSAPQYWERYFLVCFCLVIRSTELFLFHKFNTCEFTILVIIFWDILMFDKIFVSPQVKRIVIISNKHGIYELPQELPNDVRLKPLGN